MPLFQDITAVIYDLDGTIIDSDQLHLDAWKYTGTCFSFEVTAEQLSALKGLSSKKTLEALLPPEQQKIIPEASDVKFQYLLDHLKEVPLVGNFLEAYQSLTSHNIPVGVCTSARQAFVEGIIKNVPALSILEGKVVWKEMFREGKPSAEPLLTTLRRMEITAPPSAVYVGDGYSDYGSALNAEMPFVYFCSQERDARVPSDISVISDHRELLPYLRLP